MPSQTPTNDAKAYALALGLVLQQLRGRRALSQKQVAEGVGISQPTLSRIENGTSNCDPLTFRKLAELLGVTVDQLHTQVDQSLQKAKEAVEVTSPGQTGESSWWEAGIAIAGVLGLMGLLAFAVAAALAESGVGDAPSGGHVAPTPAQPDDKTGSA